MRMSRAAAGMQYSHNEIRASQLSAIGSILAFNAAKSGRLKIEVQDRNLVSESIMFDLEAPFEPAEMHRFVVDLAEFFIGQAHLLRAANQELAAKWPELGQISRERQGAMVIAQALQVPPKGLISRLRQFFFWRRREKADI